MSAPITDNRSRQTLFPLFQLAVFVAATAQPPVEVKLCRPFVTGQVFSYAAVARSYRQTIVSTEGAVVVETVKEVRCELAAALEVGRVSEEGRPREFFLRVFRLVVQEGFSAASAADATAELLEPGEALRVVYPEAGGAPQVVSADGGELATEVVAALRLLLPAPAGGRDDDALFGPGGYVRFGDRWGVDQEATLRALSEGGLEVDPAQFEGEVVLSSIDFKGGYEVQVDLRGGRAGVVLPDGYATRAGELSSRLRLILPGDPLLPPLAEEEQYSLRSHALGREGERLMAIDLVFFQSRRSRYRLVGAGG